MLHLLVLAVAAVLLFPQISQVLKLGGVSHGDMTFVALDAARICTDCSIIQASGTLGTDTAKAYRDFINRNPYKKNVYFILDSRGGAKSSAVELGKALRALKAHTIIGNAVIRDGEVEIEPGICTSACVFVFISGTTRSMANHSRLGVHNGMPRGLKKQEAGEEEKPQPINQLTIDLLSQNISEDFEYFDSMGIDLHAAILALKTPHDSIAWVSPRDRSLWGLVTLDSSLSTKSGRRWPVLFVPESDSPDEAG
jgi:hypothetical protein